MDIEFDPADLVKAFEGSPKKLTKLCNCVETVILSDGSLAEIQIVITTKEEEFIKHHNKMRGYIN